MQSVVLVQVRLQNAVDPLGASLPGGLVGQVPRDVVDDDPDADGGGIAADVEVVGTGFIEEDDDVEPGQADLFVVVGDPGGEVALLVIGEDAGRVVNGQ